MKLPSKFDIEISDYWSVNLGVKKKILNDRGVINLSVRDVFASGVHESIRSVPNEFYAYNKRRGERFFYHWL